MRFISSRVHTYIGLVLGAVLILVPWILGFYDDAKPLGTATIVGIFIILSELTTTSRASPFRAVRMWIHLLVDIVTGAFLILSPWLIQFADRNASVWLPHIVLGVLVAGYALLTNTADATPPIGPDRINP